VSDASRPAVPAERGREIEEPSRWPWISLLPIGLGAWAPIYAGVKARTPSWVALGLFWSLIVIAGFVANAVSPSGHAGEDEFAGFLMILGWVGAIATSFSIRSSYERKLSSPMLQAVEAGRERLAERQHALDLARTNPKLAREIGVGRPDRPGAVDGGLVDVNNAGASALLGLPGVDDGLATGIIETRERVGGFTSVEDLGATMNLPGDLVERLRDGAVFLPRA
jgi:hypothetical protein